MKRIQLIVCGFILFATCTKEETTPRLYPRVETGEVTNISSKGALFQGEITYASNDILDHGFIWSTDEPPTFQNSDKMSLGGKTGTGNFSATVDRSLGEGVKYYVRAYAKSDKYLVYGEVVSFLSLGSKAPSITDFNPKEAELEDTISIRGNNFSSRKDVDVVQFNNTKAIVTMASDTLLKVIVPTALPEVTSQLSVSISGNKGTALTPFTLLPPQLTGTDKSTVGLCDTLLLTAEHVPEDLSIMVITINEIQVSPLSVIGNKLKLKVPFLPTSTTAVSVKLVYGGQQSTLSPPITFLQPQLQNFNPTTVGFLDTLTVSMANIPLCGFTIKIDNASVIPLELKNNYFKVIIPATIIGNTVDLKTFFGSNLLFQSTIPRVVKIESITPASATFGDVVVIKGSGFHPDPSKNQVCFNCNYNYGINPAQIVSGSTHELTVKVPQEFSGSSNGISSIFVIVPLYLGASKDNAFQLKPPVITSITPLIITKGAALTVTGENFNPNISYNSLTLDKNTRTLWITSATPTVLTVDVTNDVIRPGNGVNDPYPSYESVDYVSSLTLNVSGQSVTANSPVQVSYVGPWTKKSDFPGASRSSGLTLSFDDKIYFGMGRSIANPTAVLSDFWEYDPATDQWQQLSDFPGAPRDNPLGWVLNNLGYAGFGQDATYSYLKDLWRFNPSNKSWTHLSDFPGAPMTNEGVAVFDSHAYIAAGYYKEVWTFDQQEAWTRLNDFPYYFSSFAVTKNAMYSMMTPSGASSYDYQFYMYIPSIDSWTATSIFATPNNQYVSGYGRAYSVNYANMGILNTATMQWDNIYTIVPSSPDYSIPQAFISQNKIYFISKDNKFYQLDMSLYPPL